MPYYAVSLIGILVHNSETPGTISERLEQVKKILADDVSPTTGKSLTGKEKQALRAEQKLLKEQLGIKPEGTAATPEPVPEGRTGAGRSDPHGHPAGEQLRKQLADAEKELADLVAAQGSRREKVALKAKIKNLTQEIQEMEKGETHWMKGK